MAKQNPATDPVSAAMSAIESALESDGRRRGRPCLGRQCFLAPARSGKADDRNACPQANSARRRCAGAPSRGLVSPGAAENETKPAISAAAPANDDRENVGAVLQAMNARPASRTPFILALIASLIWAAICALYAYVSLRPSASTAAFEMLLRPETPLFLLAALGPIIFMFAFAALSRRLRELRQSARAISAGRGASGRTRDDGGRACSEPVPGHPARTHVDGGWRRARACPRRGARDPRAV